jgi:hypothetical protein
VAAGMGAAFIFRDLQENKPKRKMISKMYRFMQGIT